MVTYPPIWGSEIEAAPIQTDTKATVADHVIVQDVAALLQHGMIVLDSFRL
jgi:hypothetical protein